MTQDGSASPAGTRPDDPLAALRSRTGTALLTATVIASMVGFLDAYMVNVAIPSIGTALEASVSQLQWVVTGYLLAVASLLLLAGALADHFGRRRILVVGLGIMFIASLACAAAPNVELLIAARAIQGIGGALVVPSSLALLNGTLRPADRTKGIGVWAGVSTLGTTLGPYGGGWLIDHGSWRYVFLLNIPLIAAAYWVLRHVPEVQRFRRPLSLDLAGGLVTVLGLGGVIYALTAGPSSGWGSAPVLVTAVVGVGCLVVLVPLEQRRAAPMVRTALFKIRQFVAINATTVLFYGALSAAAYLVVLQCQLQLGYSATAAGAALVPESVVFLLVSPFVGSLVARVGTRWPMSAGILLVAGGFAWLSTAQPGDSYLTSVLPGALLWGLGLGLAVAPLTAAVLAAVDDSDLGEASAVNDAASRVGGVILVALVPALIGAGGAHDLAGPLADGYRTAMLVLAGVSVVGAVITVLFVASGRPTVAQLPHAQPRLHGCAVPTS
jgi:EmrB/QacA subfamily drug resistance transporter